MINVGCICAKFVIWVNWLYLGKNWLYSGKLVVFGQNGYIWAKLVLFEHIACRWSKLILFAQIGCIFAIWLYPNTTKFAQIQPNLPKYNQFAPIQIILPK